MKATHVVAEHSAGVNSPGIPSACMVAETLREGRQATHDSEYVVRSGLSGQDSPGQQGGRFVKCERTN